MPINYWIPEFGLITGDRAELCNGDWLTDKHVDAVSKLLAAQFSDVEGH